MSCVDTPTMWRSEPDSDSVGVKPGVGELSLVSVLTNKAPCIVCWTGMTGAIRGVSLEECSNREPRMVHNRYISQ